MDYYHRDLFILKHSHYRIRRNMPSARSLQLDYQTFLEKVSNKEISIYCDNWGSIVAAKGGAYSDASGLATFYGGILIFLVSIGCSFYYHWACCIAGLFIMLKMIGMSSRIRHQNFIHACIRTQNFMPWRLKTIGFLLNETPTLSNPKSMSKQSLKNTNRNTKFS